MRYAASAATPRAGISSTSRSTHRPAAQLTYDVARDCPGNDCVIGGIEHFTTVLHDNGAPARERLEALKFVVHFVADLHQPFHASNDNVRGGNTVAVILNGRETSMHAVWDLGILAQVVGRDERAYALQLARAITSAERDQWSASGTAAWATESFEIAQRLIYGEWPHGPGALPDDYAAKALPVVNAQIEKAGVRLAAVLNAALR